MENRIRGYVEEVFSDITETEQVREVKEEVAIHLIEKVRDYQSNGSSEEEAFHEAVSSLGDMGELVENLRKSSESTNRNGAHQRPPVDKLHLFGYLFAVAAMLIGVAVTGIVYLQSENLLNTVSTFMPFIVVSTMLFVYLGLTQETINFYPMKKGRAMIYSAATGLLLFGVFLGGIVYFSGSELFEVVATIMPFTISAILTFMYLGLTEKSRSKTGDYWQQYYKQNYGRNPKEVHMRSNASGALWIFTTALFFILGFTIGFEISWIVFIVASGIEVLIENHYAKKDSKSI